MHYESLKDSSETPRKAVGCLGKNESLGEAFASCTPRLLRVADCILHNHHDSEDALQDSFLSTLRHLDQFRGHAQLSTWLYSIVRNAALARLRRQHVRTVVSIDEHELEDESEMSPLEFLADPGPGPETLCARSELSAAFADAFELLPENYQSIIWLCDFEGFSGKEAARELGLTPSALKAQHHRARKAIRECMRTRSGMFSGPGTKRLLGRGVAAPTRASVK
jgi:RNA polymerase sigma-70 factor (ECF subfamily)